MNKRKTLLISILILVAGAVITFIIFTTEPESKPSGATKKTAMLVDVKEVHRDTFQPTIVATGTVQPSQDIVLSPRVSGEIIARSENFVPGGFVKKGEMLLQIDPSDYRNMVQQRKGELAQAKADLSMELGRQDVAKKDFELVGDTLTQGWSEENRSLVLRQPQLQSAQANVESAEASVNQAELNLQRTTIRAPFDAHIISRNANVGSQVAPGENLGRLVGIDEYWVVATVPLSKVNWLTFPGSENDEGSHVKITNQNAWGKGVERTGYLFRQIGALEDQTRLARIIVTVSDPMSYSPKNKSKPTLIVGSFVNAHINAEEIPDVVRLNRDHLRQNGTVWVMKDGKLRIREVDIVFEDANYAYIRSGLEEGEKVVTTNLSTVVDGSPLRLEGDTSKAEANSENSKTGEGG